MFFDAERIAAVRQMILAERRGRPARGAGQAAARCSAADFAEIFEVMAGLPVTIRLLDPPLHEFLPHADEEFAEVAKASGIGVETLKQRAVSCTSSTRCSAIAAAVWASPIPKSTRCRRAPSSRRPAMSRRRDGAPIVPEDHDPAGRHRRELELMKRVVDRMARRRCSPKAGQPSTISSAR
jgi:pyruvate,orthophosphate dikinase